MRKNLENHKKTDRDNFTDTMLPMKKGAVTQRRIHRKNTFKKPKVSVVVPIYNERESIERFHNALISSLQNQSNPFEIIYVDDYSLDGSFEYLTNLKDLQVKVIRKDGKKGKAYSLLQGFKLAQGDQLVMIDADLQYPPDAIPGMLEKLKDADIVVAERKKYHDSFIRKFLSKGFRFLFGRGLFGLKTDIQSGLKAFKREVIATVVFTPSSPWTFDLSFLYRAQQAGFTIEGYPIVFANRMQGKSKVSVIGAAVELAQNAVKLKFSKIPPLIINPVSAMRGAGIGYKKRKYITHSTLPFSFSALQTFSMTQKLLIAAFFALVIGGFIFSPLRAVQVFVAVLSLLYFADTVFNLFLVLRSLRNSEEIKVENDELQKIIDSDLPGYTILCPLYKEAHVIPQFVTAISRIDWPKDKLDVMLLLEEDDTATIEAVKEMKLPSYVRTVVVPDSQPKTKPKACNYGLSFAKGEYLVIYDAEDMPDPLQLKKAYLGFQKTSKNVVCLQAKLSYYNANQNMLTRFFTAEYALWFDLVLTGLQSFHSTIPLGGTSNHFKTSMLKELEGWDAFNVTEDADLGIRLFKRGFETAIIDSTTYEEANSKTKNWIRQRSRWIKGYMQTYLVHMRHLPSFVKEKGLWHNFIFQLTVGGKLLFILLNPLMWVVTISYFVSYQVTGPLIEMIYVPPISYFAVFSWIFGNFLFLYYYMIGCAKRNQWELVKYIVFIPAYWFLMSVAAGIALYQLILKPHYWEKTVHGLHLGKKPTEQLAGAVAPQPVVLPIPSVVPSGGSWSRYSIPPVRAMGQKAASSSGFSLFIPAFLLIVATFDIAMARIFLSGEELATYVFLSLLSKFVFFSAVIFAKTFTMFAKKAKAEVILRHELFVAFLVSWSGFVTFGIKGASVMPLLFGEAYSGALSYLNYSTFAFMCLAVASIIAFAHRKTRPYFIGITQALLLVLFIGSVFIFHENLSQFVKDVVFVSAFDIIVMILLHVNTKITHLFEVNIRNIFGLFTRKTEVNSSSIQGRRILLFNWRDTKHIYAGGAERYIHELAKRWIADGNSVTLFCGNDNRNLSYEVVDGVEVYRHGGTFTVYLFAFLYYLLEFRGKYDIIVDCENGIPFFTPLYTRTPVVLLIHHVHQEIFRVFLEFPMRQIAAFLEGKIMPFVYRNKEIVTVSESSKKDIIKLGFTTPDRIDVIYNGVDQILQPQVVKTAYPSFVYLGRLKEYKNIDVAIRAFAPIVKEFSEARLSIVGWGETYHQLRRLVQSLHLENSVFFFGRVTEEEKHEILASQWVMLQPSHMEGWGITVLEANACGTPVIASKVPGLVDSVVDGKTGMLVGVKEVAEMSQAMRKIVTMGAERERLSEGAVLWSQQFTWEKSATAFYTVFAKNLEQTPQMAYTYNGIVVPASNESA